MDVLVRQHSRRCLITSAGALAMLVGFMILGQAAGTYRLSELVDDPPSGTAVEVALASRAGRGVHEVGPVPGARLAPGGDGRTHTGERIPALGHDGQGRCVPDRTPLAGVFASVDFWRPVVVFVGLYTMVAAGLAGASPDRSQAAAGDGHGEPTRLHDRRARARDRPNRRSPVASCCSPTVSTRRRRSWWSASSTTSTDRATPA